MAQNEENAPEAQRKLAITQLDEIWSIAAKRWGDPGRRTPKPDPKFEQLRSHLTGIEQLFGQNSSMAHPAVTSVKRKIEVRRGVSSDDDEFDEMLNSPVAPPF